MNKTILTLMAGSALVLSAACASSGGSGGVPDEFRVVKKAPLSVPPEYSLRPPEQGVVRPIEVSRDAQNQIVAFGTDIGQNASAVEQMLIARANAIAVSPVIRQTVDYEEAGLLRKDSSISDAVTSYSGNEAEQARAAEDNATGGAAVTIERGSGTRIKLPGT